MFSFLDQLIGSQLDVLIKQVTSQDLFSVFVIDAVGVVEEEAESCFGYELEILVVEEDIVVVKE
jgi:hypothetical protein